MHHGVDFLHSGLTTRLIPGRTILCRILPARTRERDSEAIQSVVRMYLRQIFRAALGAGLDSQHAEDLRAGSAKSNRLAFSARRV